MLIVVIMCLCITDCHYFSISKDEMSVDNEKNNIVRPQHRKGKKGFLKHVGEENIVFPDDVEWNEFVLDTICYYSQDKGYDVSFCNTKLVDDKNHFVIYYPQLTYKNGKDAKKVNEIIKECACRQMNAMYPEFTYNKKLDKGLYESTVSYEITYMDDDFISVVFYDHYLAGSIFAEYFDTRAVTIDLKSNVSYNLEDVINVDDQFATDVYNKLLAVSKRDWASRKEFNVDTMKDTLQKGTTDDNRYSCDFFLVAAGRIGLNLSFHYKDDGILSRGNEILYIDKSAYEKKVVAESTSLWNRYLDIDDTVSVVATNPDTYVVQKDDYLKKIAKKVYGDEERWVEIYELNKEQIADPNIIYKNQVFKLK